MVCVNLLHFIYLCVLQIQIEEEEKKLKAAIEEAERQYSEVSSEMKDLEIKSKQFEELEEWLVSFLLAIIVSGIFLLQLCCLSFVSFLCTWSCWGILSQNHGLCTTLYKVLTPSASFVWLLLFIMLEISFMQN